MTRDEALLELKKKIAEDVRELLEDEFADDIEATEITNLSQLAEICQNAGWDWPAFVREVLGLFGFSSDLGDFGSWANAHGYGWDT